MTEQEREGRPLDDTTMEEWVVEVREAVEET
jgi:hypothetical protein